jgi:hypothetical protein
VRGAGFTADCEKLNAAALAGWLVLRVTSAHVADGRALAWILEALALPVVGPSPIGAPRAVVARHGES